MSAVHLLGGLPRPLMAHCVGVLMKALTYVLKRQMVDHTARAGRPKWGAHPLVWAHDSSAQEDQTLPSAPPRGMDGAYMVC